MLVVPGQRLHRLYAKINFLEIGVILHFAIKETLNWPESESRKRSKE